MVDYTGLITGTLAGGTLTTSVILWYLNRKKSKAEVAEIQVDGSVKLVKGYQLYIDEMRKGMREMEARWKQKFDDNDVRWQQKFDTEHNECQEMKKDFQQKIDLLQKALHDLKI